MVWSQELIFWGLCHWHDYHLRISASRLYLAGPFGFPLSRLACSSTLLPISCTRFRHLGMPFSALLAHEHLGPSTLLVTLIGTLTHTPSVQDNSGGSFSQTSHLPLSLSLFSFLSLGWIFDFTEHVGMPAHFPLARNEWPDL